MVLNVTYRQIQPVCEKSFVDLGFFLRTRKHFKNLTLRLFLTVSIDQHNVTCPFLNQSLTRAMQFPGPGLIEAR